MAPEKTTDNVPVKLVVRLLLLSYALMVTGADPPAVKVVVVPVTIK